MLSRLLHIFVSPKVWLAAGVFCFGSSIVVGYHQDQMAANSVLAQKVGLPPEVLLQNYIPEEHTNIVDELQVLAEVALAGAALVNVGSDDTPHWLAAVPIYPVTSVSQPFVVQYHSAKPNRSRRPMPRANAPLLAKSAKAEESIQRQPLGVILADLNNGASLNSPASLGLAVLGSGLNGPLVRIVGVELHGDKLYQSAADALAMQGINVIPEALMVSPYADLRGAALAVRDLTPIRYALIWSAIALVGIALLLRYPISWPLRRRAPAAIQEVEAVHSFPAVFQPIRTQAEIASEQEEDEEAKPRKGRILSKVVGQVVDGAADALRPFKNQQ